MRNHEPITVREFGGLFNRGEDESVPFDHFLDSRNVRFLHEGVKTREGSSLVVTHGSVVRFYAYKRIGEATRLLLLDGTGKLFDATASLVTPILNIVGMVDFSAVTLFNRAYITPHNGLVGLAGEKVYVYDGTGTARAAAGVAPTGFSLVPNNSAMAGHVEVGQKLLAVSYETASGYITTPGPAVFSSYTVAGNLKLDVSAIPVGPAGTVARHLLSTKTLINYDGNQAVQTFYFIPGGRIGNNVDTTATVDFYDSDLIDDATYLLEQLPEIPAGVGIQKYRGRLVVWGSNADASVVYISKDGEPESINGADGFVTVDPGDADQGVKNCTEYRSLLYLAKSRRTYSTQDNGDVPATWVVVEVDSSSGTEAHGIAKVLDTQGSMMDYFIIADRRGLMIFNGVYILDTLTWKIDDIWASINQAVFHKVQVIIDPSQSLIFVVVPIGVTLEANTLLVGDFENGLDPKNIRWDIWEFSGVPVTCIEMDVDNTTKVSYLMRGYSSGNIYKLNTGSTDDNGSAIDSYIQTGHTPNSDGADLYHVAGLRLRAKGSGSLSVSFLGLDGGSSAGAAIALPGTFGLGQERLTTLTTIAAGVKLRVATIGSFFTITKLSLFVKKLWEGSPR